MMTKDPARIVTSDALDPMGGRQMSRVCNTYAMDGTTFEGQSQGREASDDLGAGLYANLPSFTLSLFPSRVLPFMAPVLMFPWQLDKGR